ncbi:dipeptide ABC transporter ATP-binding protein [Salinibius halmophilus]|uniref:dipeptide ABC transporter ATP-binding protein n=1 Tax=Salinibius halmophilus TaxID=1853216 RepID=UPI000E667CE9|nr:ABC transporter ATP-binding protein [Salinibius halmophilus]
MSQAILSIKDLSIHYISEDKIVPAVNKVSFDIHPGEVFGLAGESGCGKSTIAFAISRLTKLPGLITGGEILYQGIDVLSLNQEALRQYRWAETSLVFQSAMDALNPVLSIEEQICDTLFAHQKIDKKQARERASELLELVGIDPARMGEYAHQFSGGMRQRIGIALALALKPKLIIMDEPTTALDVVVQRDIIEKIYQLKEQFGFAVLYISHDLSMMAEFSDRIGVMKDGELLEVAPAKQIWRQPEHPYTRQLAKAFMSMNNASAGGARANVHHQPILALNQVSKQFKTKAGFLRSKPFNALTNVSFELNPGEAMALVGESGSGKSTCAKILSQVYAPSSGELLFHGKNVWQEKASKQAYRKAVQMIFQDPFGSLNPTLNVGYQLARPVQIHHPHYSTKEVQVRVDQLLELVGLPSAWARRYPHELSGGQRQRVAIARVLAVEPEVILADEPTSMLDVSLRTGILNLLKQLKDDFNIAFLYITHDIATARYFAERTAVMYRGTIVEWGNSDAVTEDPRHPYTRTLLEAIPNPDHHLSENRQTSLMQQIWNPNGRGCTHSHYCEGPCQHELTTVQISPHHFVRHFDFGPYHDSLKHMPKKRA